MPDNAKIVVIDVEVFDPEKVSYIPFSSMVCRKKAELLTFRSGLDYLHELNLARELDFSGYDHARVCFRVFERPPYKLAFCFVREYFGEYSVKSGIEYPVLSCDSFDFFDGD